MLRRRCRWASYEGGRMGFGVGSNFNGDTKWTYKLSQLNIQSRTERPVKERMVRIPEWGSNRIWHMAHFFHFAEGGCVPSTNRRALLQTRWTWIPQNAFITPSTGPYYKEHNVHRFAGPYLEKQNSPFRTLMPLWKRLCKPQVDLPVG